MLAKFVPGTFRRAEFYSQRGANQERSGNAEGVAPGVTVALNTVVCGITVALKWIGDVRDGQMY